MSATEQSATDTGERTAAPRRAHVRPTADAAVENRPRHPGSQPPRSPFPIRAEIGRQLRRRRTQGIFVVLTLLPLILVLAFWLGDDGNDSGQRGFVDLAQDSGANLTVFALFASTSFLLIVIVALFAGDTVPSEASWSSLRYLLAAPVRRERLLRQKLVVAALSSVVALIFLPAWTLLVGGIAYGWGAYVGPTGDQLTLGTFLGRLGIIVAYLLVELSVVAAFAFALGVLTDAPLAAVGGAVLLMILCAILDSITALGGIRQGLPGHYAFAWADALAPTVNYSDMVTGALWSIGYAIVLIGVAVWHFLRKDITS
jgi:ABC-2 type transport system permease protein